VPALGTIGQRGSANLQEITSGEFPVQSITEYVEGVPCALTAADLAHILNVSRITIFKMAKAGRIPCFRIGTCVRFDPKTIAAWLRGEAVRG
jgi:excisionase family DNA binding protein